MGNNDELISQFTSITGVDAERARFFLESSAWKLEVALTSFYENCGSDSPDIVEIDNETPSDVASSRPPVEPTPSSSVLKPKKKPAPSSRFGTIASLKDNDENSEEDEGLAFYAGGSEHSGQQVIGPGKKKMDIVAEMFKSVQEQGAEIVDASNPVARSSAFEGTGYRLGQTSNDTEVVKSGSSTGSKQSSQTAPVTLKLWREGFNIDDGPIREYANPENQEFLNSIRRGEVPQELVRNARGAEFHLNMEDHRFEEHTAPKTKVKAFAGEGHVLGSPSPAVVGTTKILDEKDRVANENQAKQSIPVDESSPTTSIQIRLADGTRLVAKLNHSHTIADVRRYITIARPHYELQTFTLMTTFPSKELSDSSQTLEQAGILNASLLQRPT